MFRKAMNLVVEFRTAVLWLAALTAIGVTACGSDSDVNGPSIGISSNQRLGSLLVSSNGRTLYYFGLDLPAAGGQAALSNCSGSCLDAWPIFHVDAPSLAQGLSAADVGEIVRPDGTKQTTFKGWPVYFYAGDHRPGDTNGDNLEVWFVLRDPFYSALLMTKAAGPSLYMADPSGRSLYVSPLDTVGSPGVDPVSACNGGCLNNWPVFLAGPGTVPTGLDPAKLAVFARADGVMQSAYDGHPLYHFANDAVAGDIKGRGVAGRDIADPTSL